jgi:transcriptional regulator with XRE-family HTH domain
MKKISEANVEMGRRLRVMRLDRGLSIETVAIQIGVAPSTYREWENGRAVSGNPYAKISQALGVGVYQILGIQDESKYQLLACVIELEKSIQNLKRHL